MEREQFTFYASFAKAISRIKKKADRCEAYDAITRYALYGEQPDLDAMADAAAITFDLIKPVLDTAKRKAENGKKGGSKAEAKSKQNASKTEAKRKQTASDIEVEGEKEGEIEVEGENECSIPPVIPPLPETHAEAQAEICEFAGELGSAFADWIAYKKERRESYQAVGYKNLVTQVRKAADTYGEAAVAEQIRNSIASRYQGITFDRLKKTTPNGNGANRYSWMETAVLE